LAVEIQQIPAPTFAEAARAEFVRQKFNEAGLVEVEQDDLGNVYARRPGGSGRPILVSAHLDTVFTANTDLTVTRDAQRIAGPGIGDNSLAVAGLLGLAWALDAAQVHLPGAVWLVANVGEEGLGDLRGMRAVMDRLGEQVAATLVLEGVGLGTLIQHGIGSRRYKIEVQALGGHSWSDFGQTSAIHTLVRLAHPLTYLKVPSTPKTTFNIGVIEGGTSVNTIAETASLLLDLRSESAEDLHRLVQEVEQLVGAFAAGDARLTLEVIGDRPAGRLDPDHPLYQLAERVLHEVGVAEVSARAGSTDANIPLARGYPALCLGLTTGGNMHRLSEYIEVEPFQRGLTQLVRLVVGASELFN
jgi:acetylornithine deacetylase/succinyl-diaminopimelate desuccinylase-like protein